MARRRRIEEPVRTTGERQEVQKTLVERAQAMPGVADVIELYGRYAPYVPQPSTANAIIRHSTGGNS